MVIFNSLILTTLKEFFSLKTNWCDIFIDVFCRNNENVIIFFSKTLTLTNGLQRKVSTLMLC